MNLSNDNIQQLAENIASYFVKPTSEVSIQNAGQEYAAYMKHNRSEKSYKCVQTFMNHFYGYFSIERKVNTITQRDAEKFIIALKKNAPKAYRNYYRTGRAFFNVLIRWGYLNENVFTKIDLPKKQKELPSFLDESEMKKVWMRLAETKPIVARIVEIGFYTGLRIGEIVSLRWGNINLEERIITVGDKNFSTKNRKSRIIPMNNIIFNLISELKDEKIKSKIDKENFVFGKKPTKAFTVDYVSKSFKKVCRELGIDENIHAHSIRHSAASHLVRRGANLYAVKEILGHQSISTTEIYSHLRLEDLRRAVGE